MSDETGDHGFSADERRTLASVLDEIVPPSGTLPGAGALGLAGYVEHALRATPPLMTMIAQGLLELAALAVARNAPSFAALSQPDKLQLLNEQGFILPLTLHAYAGYYQEPRVVEALGLEARPPHPMGYQMEPNDLTLLDVVRRWPARYRQS